MAELAKSLTPGPSLHAVKEVQLSGGAVPLPARLFLPSAQPRAVIVYFHGGGWIFGELDEFDPAARHLAKESGCAVLLVRYRLAPENPFPAAVDDALAATRWAASLGIGRALPVIVAGDSAGGNLAAAITHIAREAGDPAISGQILVYPITSADMTSQSYVEFAEWPTLSAAAMSWFWNLYAPDSASRLDVRASPSLAIEYRGLPPALILTAEFDPLRSEGEAYAQKLGQAGVPVTLHRFEGMPHGFFTMVGLFDHSELAIAKAASWLVALLSSQAVRG